MATPILAVPTVVSNGTVEFTDEDLNNIVRHADLPDKESLDEELLHWATCSDLEMAIKEPGFDTPTYEFMNKGGLYSKGALNLFFYRKPESQVVQGIDRGHLFHLAGSIKRLFAEPVDDSYDALVGIEYGADVNPIDGSVTSPRHYEQVSFDDILDQRLSNLSGIVENVRFTGVVKARTNVKYASADGSLSRPSGLCIPIVLGVFTGSGRDEHWEPLGDRATRMLHQCSEARSLASARNVISMLNKPKLINEYKAAPKSFPRVRRVQDMAKKVDKIKLCVRAEVQKVDKLAAVCSLFETALSMFVDDDMDDYCQAHFLMRGINRAVMEQFVALAHQTLNEHGRTILINCKAELQDVMPFKVAATIAQCVDCMLPSGRWRYISSKGLGTESLGIQLVAIDGSDEIELIKFKRASVRAMLSNLGFVALKGAEEIDLNTLDTKQGLSALNIVWSSKLTPDQCTLHDLAKKMCFKTAEPPFPLSPSIAPDFAKGAVIFVHPAVTRDLPEMVADCEQRGIRIGVGVMFCSKHFTELVLNVLNTKRTTGPSGEVVRTNCKHTAFSKVESRVVLELPSNPSLSTRKLGAEEIKKQSAPNFVSDPGPGLYESKLEVCSLETRGTRSTGDLPRHSDPSRPNDCDRAHRQPLHGNIRGDGFHNRREKATLPTHHEETSAWHDHSGWDSNAHASWWSSGNGASSSSQSQSSGKNSRAKGNGKGKHGRSSGSGWQTSGWWN